MYLGKVTERMNDYCLALYRCLPGYFKGSKFSDCTFWSELFDQCFFFYFYETEEISLKKFLQGREESIFLTALILINYNLL